MNVQGLKNRANELLSKLRPFERKLSNVHIRNPDPYVDGSGQSVVSCRVISLAPRQLERDHRRIIFGPHSIHAIA
jgi:hypothetical protein